MNIKEGASKMKRFMQKTRYYHTCPCCGANLDPGERCDCEAEDISKNKGAA